MIKNQQNYKPTSPTRSSYFPSYQYGQAVTSDSALEVSAFYRGCWYLSTQIAKLPWDIKTTQNQIINERNNIWYLLNRKTNSEMPSFHFKALMMYGCLLKGNGFAEIVKDSTGRIRSFYPIMHHDVCLIRNENGVLYYQISNTNGQVLTYFKPEEILHFRGPHTEDGINGLSPINYAKKVLGIAKGADKMAGAMFENAGMPSGTLETDSVLNEDVIERLRQTWKEKYGRESSGGVAVLEQGMKFNPINFAPDVMQFLESRKFSVIEIARFLNVPPAKLYTIEAQTYNNIEHTNLEVGNDTIDVWARIFEQEIDVKVLDRSLRSEMDLHQLYRGDAKTRSDYYKSMVGIGAMTPNQVRMRDGLEPYENGDEYYISSNNLTPISRINEVIDSQISSSQPSELEQTLAAKLKKRK